MRLLVTTIFNEVLPRIRFGSGDLGYCTDEPCPCGKTSDRLVQIVGRVGEAVKLRGMLLHPLEVSDVASHFPEISHAQILVSRVGLRDVLTAKFELTTENADRDRLVDSFQKEFQNRCWLKLDEVQFVPKDSIPKDAPRVIDERSQVIL